MNHVLFWVGHNDRCSVCHVAWRGLTDRDRITLTTAGKCIGQPERWRPCPVTKQMCLGARPGHEECL